ncbi:MAG: hypothetical protein XD95_0275 [Microgenomates bacterium 39_7]|nr:MAG: hypothetical protein XD95_0275 [Microgenomates bacterium 39_7]
MKNSNVQSSDLLFNQAKLMGLQPRWEAEYGLFSILPVGVKQRQYFFHTNLNLNGELSRILVKNKHFTRLIIEQTGLVNIPYILPSSREQLNDFFEEHQPLICKPLLGQQSQNVKLIQSQEKLEHCSLKMTFFEKYIEGVEHRYLVLNNEVIAVQKKEREPTKDDPWKLFYTGLEKKNWDLKLSKLALKITNLFQLSWAGVDFIVDQQGNGWILEVNSAPGIVKIHHPDAGISTNAAKLIWQAVLKKGQRLSL